MTIEKLEEFLNEGEGYTLEYKESVNSLSDSVFETVSSFSKPLRWIYIAWHKGSETGQ